MIVFPAKVAAARAAAGLSRRAGAGGGTSLPGKLLLRMAPDAIPRLSRRIAGGTVVVSATNGKTTTSKMLAAMLEPERRLCRNSAGANLASGVASALLACRGADLGVFEVDEAALEAVAPALAAAGARAREPVPRPARPLRRARGRRGPLAEISAARPVAAPRPKRRRPARGGAARERRDRSRTASTTRASALAGPAARRRLEVVRGLRRAAALRRGVSRAPRRLGVPRLRKCAARARRVGDRRRVRRPRRDPASRFGRRSASGSVEHAAARPLQRLQRARGRRDGLRHR